MTDVTSAKLMSMHFHGWSRGLKTGMRPGFDSRSGRRGTVRIRRVKRTHGAPTILAPVPPGGALFFVGLPFELFP